MNKRIKNDLPLTVDERAKAHIKAAAVERFNTSKKRSIRQLFGGHKKLATGLLSGLLIFTILGGFLLGRNPLTMQRVLAGAIENLDQKTAGGKWTYRKTRDTMEFKNGKSYTTTNESWSATSIHSMTFDVSASQMLNSSYKVTLDDGRILDENVMIDGISYTRDTREVYKDVFGYDPYGSFSETSSEMLPPGFAEAGLTIDAFSTMSMKQIDDALVAVGQEPMNAPSYKTTDFPAYSMTPAEIEAYMKERETNQQNSEEAYNELYGGAENNVVYNLVTTADGQQLSGEEADQYLEKEQARYEDFNKLRMGSIAEKKQALEKILREGSATFKEDVEFEGKRVVAIETDNSATTGSMETIYLDAKSFDIVGEEYVYELTDEMMVAIPDAMRESIPVRVKTVYLELRFTDELPQLSADGLTKTEDLYGITEVKPAE